MAEALNTTIGSATSTASVGLDGEYNVSIWGTFVATVSLYRSFDDGTTWLIVDTFAAADEKIGEELENDALFKFIATSYTSGTVSVRLGQSDNP